MTSRSSLINVISSSFGVNKHTLDRIGIELNQAGLIRSGGRGKNAMPMNAEDFKNIVLATLGSNNPKDAVKAVTELGGLQDENGTTFSAAIMGLMNDQTAQGRLDAISVNRDLSEAEICFVDVQEIRDDSGLFVLNDEQVPEFWVFKNPAIANDTRGALRVEAILNGGAFTALVKVVDLIQEQTRE